MRRVPGLMAGALAALGAALPSRAPAQENFCAPLTSLYFSGGVWSDPVEAKLSLIAVQDRLRGLDSFGNFRFSVARNPVFQHFDDLIDRYVAEGGSKSTKFWEQLGGVSAMEDSIRDGIEELGGGITEDAYLGHRDFERDPSAQENAFKSDFRQGWQVLVVAHGEASYWANHLFNELSAAGQKSYGVLAVADPDPDGFPTQRHRTAEEDLVIEALRRARPGTDDDPPPENADNGAGNDTTGHLFRPSYMRPGAETLAEMPRNIRAVVSDLEFSKEAVRMLVTAKLTWDDAVQDLDLHVFEPEGENAGDEHVWRAEKIGEFGKLTRSDRTGPGTERYRAELDCAELDELLEQTARVAFGIGVNYFRGGTPPAEATVVVQAGSEKDPEDEELTKTLDTRGGRPGNQNPVPVARVFIVRTDANGFRFTIAPPPPSPD